MRRETRINAKMGITMRLTRKPCVAVTFPRCRVRWLMAMKKHAASLAKSFPSFRKAALLGNGWASTQVVISVFYVLLFFKVPYGDHDLILVLAGGHVNGADCYRDGVATAAKRGHAGGHARTLDRHTLTISTIELFTQDASAFTIPYRIFSPSLMAPYPIGNKLFHHRRNGVGSAANSMAGLRFSRCLRKRWYNIG